jgi:hypothetical protein
MTFRKWTKEQILSSDMSALAKATLLKAIDPRPTAAEIPEKAEGKKPRAKHGSNPEMKLCDEIYMARFRGKPCAVCASQGKLNTNRTALHHIIARSRSRFLRYDPRNGVILCPRHHCFGGSPCAHGFNSMAIAAFVDWLKEHRAEDWAYCKDNEHTPCRETWKMSLRKLLGGKQ